MRPEAADENDIAIIGMAGRFPGARDVESFWQNLCAGVESIRPLADAELDALGVDAALRRDPRYVKAAAALDAMDRFDAAFFGYSPREAELMDPQHRVFLECCWEALERAGYAPDACPGAVGLFGGAATNTYLLYHLASRPDLLSALDQVQIDVGNGADFLMTRVAYKLNLRGPSFTIQSACSTSLVATHVACQSLLGEECDMALAGGVSIHVKHPEGYRYLPGGIVSPDGHCRAFDAGAGGTVFGSGAGVVVLKRLRDALRDRDQIHAVIRGSAVNNDGAGKVGYTAPGADGQAAVIREALAAAGVKPETIGYLETHGTGTPLGDAVEIRAIARALKPRSGAAPTPPCLIGSLKPNVGHLANAAGVASLIKAALAIEHGRIPPSLHVQTPNPELALAPVPLVVNTSLSAWPDRAGAPRRAGVSSFGVGGTNAHVVLEEAPLPAPTGPSRPAQLLLLSARTRSALAAAASNLAEHLRARPGISLADVAYTLQVGRTAMAERMALVCRDPEDALRALEGREEARLLTSTPATQDRPVAMLFPGQGAQYVDMARGLHEHEPVFREHLDECATLLRPHLGLDLRAALYPGPAQREEAARRLEQTALTQPALFAVEYALAKLWMALGVKPAAMLGHSVGEYVAACLAGVMSLPDALALVAVRGQLMQSLPPGAMISVPLPEDELSRGLPEGCSIAAVNGPALTVVAGPIPAVEALSARLAARGVASTRLRTSHAFHSAMMDPIVAPFTERVRRVQLAPPRIPYVSNVTGAWIEPAMATDPAYWAEHLRRAVRFDAGLAALLAGPSRALLEVGPGGTLSVLARQRAGGGDAIIVASARRPREAAPDVEVLLGALARLWLGGVRVDWGRFSAHERRRRLPLPTYPFERVRCWIDARPATSAAPPPEAARAEERRDLADWFHVPSWRRTPPPPRSPRAPRRGWLIFDDACGVAHALAARLAGAGQPVIRVRAGAAYERRDDGYTLDPRCEEDYRALARDLEAAGVPVNAVVHLWGLTPAASPPELALERGARSLLCLARAFAQPDALPRSWWVAASGACRVESADVPSPDKSALLGPCLVLPQEHPRLTCRFVDLTAPAGAGAAEALADRLAAELEAGADAPVIAYRGRHRWARIFEPLRLPGDAPPERPLLEGGVILIVGALSGPGRALAHDLAAAMDRAGVKVEVLSESPADAAALRRAFDAALARHGRIQAVIHASEGVRTDALERIRDTDPGRLGQRLSALAQEMRALGEALPREGVGACLVFSSLSSAVGGPGQVGAATAGHYLDVFAEQQSEAGSIPWLSVGWDAWRLEDGPSVAAPSPEQGERAILPAEGVEAARRLLGRAISGPIAVSTVNLAERARRRPRSGATGGEAASPGAARRPPHIRYVAPTTDMERAVARAFQQALGVDPVGVNDHFFELGGDSLIAVQVAAELGKALSMEVPAAALYQQPTVGALAALLSQSGDQATRERAERLARRRDELQRRHEQIQRRPRRA